MKITGADIAIPIVGGATFVFMYLQLPLWALFIGWAWYYALGSNTNAIKAAFPPTIAGALLAIVCFEFINWCTPMTGAEVATGIGLTITLFLLMLFLKIPGCGASLPGFNGYSCYFIGFAANTYMPIDGMHPYLNAMIWITGANLLGVLVGWVCVEWERSIDRRMSKPAIDGGCAASEG